MEDEKFCRCFVLRDVDEADGGVLPKGLALINLHLYASFHAHDPESGQRFVLDHLRRERLISIRLDIEDVRCHGSCAIKAAVHPLLIDIGVPELVQADMLKKIASSPHLRSWSKTTRVPPIKVFIGVITEVEDYEPGANAGERLRLIYPYGTVTVESGAKVRCVFCWEECGEGTRLRLLPCTHAFHESCLIEWMHKRLSTSCRLCSLIREEN